MRAADSSGNIDGNGDGYGPARGYQQPVAASVKDFGTAARLVQRRDGHRDDSVAKCKHYKGAKVLSQGLAQHGVPPVCSISLRHDSSLGDPAGVRHATRRSHAIDRRFRWGPTRDTA